MTQPVKPDHHLYYILLIKLITMLSLGSSGTCLSMEEIQRVRGPLYYASFWLLSSHRSLSYFLVPIRWDLSSFDTSFSSSPSFTISLYLAATTLLPGPFFLTLSVLIALAFCHHLLPKSQPCSNPTNSHLYSTTSYNERQENSCIGSLWALRLPSSPELLLSPTFSIALSSLSIGATSDLPTHSSATNPFPISPSHIFTVSR